MNSAPVVPAIIPASLDHIVQSAKRLAFSSELQLDLVDGQFVPTISWPYQPVGKPADVASVLSTFTLEVDLMVREQLAVAKAWEEAGADLIVFHIEGVTLSDFKKFSDATDVSVGVSAHGPTSLEELASYAEYADYIQLMGIYEIGAQGLPFDENVLVKIEKLKKIFPHLPIAIDGSVNEQTIKSLFNAGATRFICGSAIVQQPDPEVAWRKLSALVKS